MARSSIIVGLEIGTHKVCAAVGETRPDGGVRILGIGEAASCGVRKGEIVDFEAAQTCVREAIVDAEQKSDVEIKSVVLAVTGTHISSFNNRGSINIPEDRDVIDEEDIEEVELSASEVNLAPGRTFLHTFKQHYYLDGQEGVLDPLGRHGKLLEADYHVIHGISTRIKNSIRAVMEVPLEVEEVVLGGIASGLAVLDASQKMQGAAVIDMGAGTTDYVVYIDGVVRQSGVLALGGDHVTNDIVLGLRLPMAKAERLKIEEAALRIGTCVPGETIDLPEETRFAGRNIDRETLNMVAYLRVREVFELLKQRFEEEGTLDYLAAGIHLTGGCSLFDGIDDLASDVFGVPAYTGHAQQMSGNTAAFSNPQYATSIGLLKYAQIRESRTGPSTTLGGLVGKIFGVFGKLKPSFSGPRAARFSHEEGEVRA